MNRTITVKGIGKVSAKPDYIVLSMSIQAKNMKYQKTMDIATAQLENLRQVVTLVGFEHDDLKTVSFDVQPSYRSIRDSDGNYTSRFEGYVCTHELKLEFDFSMERLAHIFAVLAECQARPEFSVKFTVKDDDAIGMALLQSATENAMLKAEILTKTAGVTLGQLLAIDYSWGEMHLYSKTEYEMDDRCLMESTCGSSMDIEPEDINVNDTVTFVWEIR